MTIQVGDRLRLTMIGDMDLADEVVQSYQFRMISGAPMTDALAMDDVAEVLVALWVILKQLYAIDVVFRRLKGQDIATSRLLPEVAFSPALVGVVAGKLSPQQINLPITFLTTVPRVRLRKLFGPPGEANLTVDGVFGTSTQTVAASVSAFLLAPMIATLGTWEYGYQSPVALDWVVPDSSTFSVVPGTLRRRRLGSGS